MAPIPHKKGKYWSDEQLHYEALKYQTKRVFQKESSAYIVALRRGIIDDVCSHMKSNTQWTKETIKAEALKYTTRNEFRKESSAYIAAHKRGIIDEVCSHMSDNAKWTQETIKVEALKYTTRGEFQKQSSAYGVAYRSGLMDEVCSHMSGNAKWTPETIKEEALKYKTRNEFRKGSVSAYGGARSRDIIDAACSHMPRNLQGVHRYSHDIPGTVYFVEVEEVLKVGITLEDVKKRFAPDVRNGIIINTICTLDFSSSLDAFRFEQHLLDCTLDDQIYDRGNRDQGPLTGGNTELRTWGSYLTLKKMMDEMTPMDYRHNEKLKE